LNPRRWPARAGEWVAPLAFVALWLLSLALVVRTPALGAADNGDFWRVTDPAGLRHSLPLEQLLQRFVDPRFIAVETAWERGISSPALLAWLTRELDAAFGSDPGSMAIQSLGVVYLLLVAIVFGVSCGRDRTLWWLGVLCLWVITDPGYLLFFNSFYAEPAMIVGLVSVALWSCRFGDVRRLLLARGAERALPLAALCVALVFLGFTKLLYSPLPFALALVFVPQLWQEARLSPRAPLVFGAALLAIAVAAPAYFGGHAVQRFEHINAFNRVFVGVAVVAQNREATLARLGIAPERVRLVGTGYFKLNEAEAEQAEGATLWRTFGAYLADPRAAGRAAVRVARALAAERTIRVGQYTLEESAGERRLYQARAWHFSAWRSLAFGSSIAVALLWALGACWVIARLRRGLAPRLLAIAGLLLAVPLQAVAVVLGDGFFGLHRHLVAARLALDLALVLLVFDASAVLVTRWRSASARGSSSPFRSGSR
jgi:hypothetical protein